MICGCGRIHEVRTFTSKNGNIGFNNRPNERVIDGPILMGQLVAEINDATRPRDCIEHLRRNPGKRRHSLTDDNELPLDRGPNETILLVAMKIKMLSCVLDGLRTIQ